MRAISRSKTIIFLVLGVASITAAVFLNVSWIMRNWRDAVLLFSGIIFFLVIITGLVLNTIFLVREIRRNEQHDSFINAVTHELKTPIASIRLYLETLQRRELDPPQQQQFYGLMLEDTDRLLSTVEQVLKAGEVRVAHAKRHPVEFDFRGLVGECMDLARTRHHLPPTALYWRDSSLQSGDGAVGASSGAPVTVHGDPEELRTAITNILDNAIKYSGRQIDVSVQVEPVPDERRVALRVCDRGIGIPAHELKRIFKRFYRVRGRPFSHAKGTGLGLFIVQSIARAHGGRVFAESGGSIPGTTVTFELPRLAP
ncbi:MAG: sensor histidine kinase [Candidatus Acidiferrales bacterium]